MKQRIINSKVTNLSYSESKPRSTCSGY